MTTRTAIAGILTLLAVATASAQGIPYGVPIPGERPLRPPCLSQRDYSSEESRCERAVAERSAVIPEST
jgi:hypothetical protein